MILHGNLEMFGYIPFFIEDETQPIIPQIDANYVSGWKDFEGFTLKNWNVLGMATLSYPGDPDYREVGRLSFENGETLILFPHSWCCVITPPSEEDGMHTHRIARLD